MRPRNRSQACHGLTLVEALLSIVLLSTLFSASGWWVRETARTRASAMQTARWELAASALLAHTQDAVLEASPHKDPARSIAVSEDFSELRVHAVDPDGRLLLRYALKHDIDAEAVLLVGKDRTDLVLGETAAFRVLRSDDMSFFTLKLESTHGQHLMQQVRVQ